MFKKFNYAEDVAGRQNVKSSVQRGIKAKIVQTFPKIEGVIEDIIPKKSQLTLVKWYERGLPVVWGC
jgi:malignant T-cell-amplified sequence